MRKMTFYVIIVSIVWLVGGLSCNNAEIVENQFCSCEDMSILKVLTDEPVYVRKQCFENVGRVDAFFFELADIEKPSDFGWSLFPCGEIPEKYRKEGLLIKISGNVLSCAVFSCIEPHLRLRPIQIIELKSIKNN
jgi:hypothetical protein